MWFVHLDNAFDHVPWVCCVGHPDSMGYGACCYGPFSPYTHWRDYISLLVIIPLAELEVVAQERRCEPLLRLLPTQHGPR